MFTILVRALTCVSLVHELDIVGRENIENVDLYARYFAIIESER